MLTPRRRTNLERDGNNGSRWARLVVRTHGKSLLHRADAGRETALMPRSLVAMNDLLAGQGVDDRDRLLVAGPGRFLVAPLMAAVTLRTAVRMRERSAT